MKFKLPLLVIAAIALTAVSCNPFTASTTAGLVKTANGGADWQYANKVKDNPKASTAGFSISQLGFDPRKTDRIFAGTYNDGIYVSDDAAGSWQRILSRFSVYDFAIDPSNSDIIFAAGIFNSHGRVLGTRDGGKSWVEVFNEASNNNPVRSITLNPANTKEVIIGLASGALIKSEDSGVNWRLLQTYNDRVNRVRWSTSGLYVIVRNTGVYKSTDGGNSFINLTAPLGANYGAYGNTVGQLISSSGIATFNQVTVSGANPNLLYVTTSGGLYRSTNGGNTWEAIGLPLRQRDVTIQAVAIAPNSDNVVYVSAGTNVYKSSDGGNSWQAEETHTTGLVNSILINPQLSQVAYAGIYAQ